MRGGAGGRVRVGRLASLEKCRDMQWSGESSSDSDGGLPVNSLGTPGSQIKSVRRVQSLGRGELGQEVLPGGSCFAKRQVKCPQGHVMSAKIVREMRQFIRLGCYRCRSLTCHDCEEPIQELTQAYYRCRQCRPKLTLCHWCARRMRPRIAEVVEDEYRDMLNILPGDVLLCGPTAFGIHHVVLVRSELAPAPWMLEWFEPEPGMEIYQLSTIESTQAEKGKDTWWYTAVTFIVRDPYTGDAQLIADQPQDSETVYLVDDPVPMKVLLHPLRRDLGRPPFHVDLFEQVIQELAQVSQQYSWCTAIRAWARSHTATRQVCGVDPYLEREPEQRKVEDPEAFMEKVQQSWEFPPICATVAIKVWQKYFDSACDSMDEAAEYIATWMPLWCNATTPSRMVTTLTRCDWELRLKFVADS